MKTIFEQLLIINKFLKNFGISRKLLIVIVVLMIISAIGEALSASLIIPFLNSLQNTESSPESSNRIIQSISYFFSGVNREHRFIYVLFSILILMSFVQVLIIFTDRLIKKFTIFQTQNKVSNVLFARMLNTRLKFFYKQSRFFLLIII